MEHRVLDAASKAIQKLRASAGSDDQGAAATLELALLGVKRRDVGALTDKAIIRPKSAILSAAPNSPIALEVPGEYSNLTRSIKLTPEACRWIKERALSVPENKALFDRRFFELAMRTVNEFVSPSNCRLAWPDLTTASRLTR